MIAEEERRVMNLLPVPQGWVEAASPVSVEVSAQGTGPATVSDAGKNQQLRWLAIHDERVEQQALELLADFDFGTLDVHIDQRGAPTPGLGDDESYTLDYTSGASHLRAATTWGALHGLTTLWQLHALGTAAVTPLHIEDHPRFGWRGLLIDVARHYMSLSLLRRVVDGMARLKLNVLHLHLTDDQAFRFGSVKFPALASARHYTQDDLRGLVVYAAKRGVRIVPEIDVPGHATSWLVNYPEWGVNETSATIKFGVHKGCLNPIDEAVYTALDDLFEEVCDTFPDSYLHIGGDEVHPAWWNGDAQIQQFIEDHDLGDVRGLQAHFNRRLYAMLKARGRVAVGWDEVLHAEMPPLLVQNWRGATTRDRARARSLDCVMSCGYYLDLFYPADMHYLYDPEGSQSELLAFEDALRADPRLAHVADGIAWTEQWRSEAIDLEALDVEAARRGRVLGGEACLWSELVDEETLEVRLWSRLPAVAERLWSARGVCDVEDFYRRLTNLYQLPGLQVARSQTDALTRIGLAAAQISVAAMLEPVKWYARLLGEQALQARLSGTEMPQARPYDTTSALNRVVDFISPESLPARALAQASSDEVVATCELWQAQQPGSWPADCQAAITALIEVSGLVLEAIDTSGEAGLRRVCARLELLYRPFGEYMLAPIPVLIAWLERPERRAEADKTAR